MKNKNCIPIFIVMFVCGFCFALSDEIGDPTVPPSSIRRGLVQTPSPVDDTGNMIVTGNVGGGRHFRGTVPYRGATEFGDTLGSRDIGSFLRSTAPRSYSRNQLSARPYYLPSSTVGLTTRGTVDRSYSYPTIKSNYAIGGADIIDMPKLKPKTKIVETSPLYDYSRTRLLDYQPGDIERAMSYDLLKKQTEDKLKRALSKVNQPSVDEITEDTQTEDGQLPLQPAKPIQRSFEPDEPVQHGDRPESIKERTAAKRAGFKSVYEQMLFEAANQQLEANSKKAEESEYADKSKEQERPAGITDLKSPLSEITDETAEAVVGVHKTFAADSNDKFNFYMRTAEDYMQEGKYYRAVDAYTLASIYKPDDALAFAGKSHALFASGEYMSSAYFLVRAVTVFPQYLEFKVDLDVMIPDKDKLQSRITDIRSWIEKTESAELSFLLAYIYHQLNKPDLAVGAINFAIEKMPDSPSALALKKAIENK